MPQFQGRESKRVSQRLWCHAPAIRKVHSFLHFFFFGVHNEQRIMVTGNCGVCGLPRDASCFWEEYINRN